MAENTEKKLIDDDDDNISGATCQVFGCKCTGYAKSPRPGICGAPACGHAANQHK